MLERRRRRRFPAQLPVVLKIQEQAGWCEVRGISENASEIGVLLFANRNVPLGAAVEVSISMPNGVQLSALGTVVRTTPGYGRDKFAIAVQCTAFSES